MNEAGSAELSQNDRVRAEESMDSEDIEGKLTFCISHQVNLVLHL